MSLINDIYDIELKDNEEYRGVFNEQFSQYYKNFEQFEAMSTFLADRMGKYIKYLDNFHPKSPHYKDRLKKKFKLSSVIPETMIQNTTITIIDLVKKRGSKSIFLQLLKENNFKLTFERLIISSVDPLTVIGETTEEKYDHSIISNKLGIDFNGIDVNNLPVSTAIYVIKDQSTINQESYIKKFKEILDIMNFDNNPIFDVMCSNNLTFRENYNFICMFDCIINDSFIPDINSMDAVPSVFLSPMDKKYKNSMSLCYKKYNPTMAEIDEICYIIFKSNMYSSIILPNTTNYPLTAAVQADINNNRLYTKIALTALAQSVELQSTITKSSNINHSYNYYIEKEFDRKSIFYSTKKRADVEIYRKLLLYYQSVLDVNMIRADNIIIYEILRNKFNELQPLDGIVGISPTDPGKTVILENDIQITLEFNDIIYDKNVSYNILNKLIDFIPMNIQFLNYEEVSTTSLASNTIDLNGELSGGNGNGNGLSLLNFSHSLRKYVDNSEWKSLYHEIKIESIKGDSGSSQYHSLVLDNIISGSINDKQSQELLIEHTLTLVE